MTKIDTHAAHTVFELLPPDSSLFSVGRLDRDTTGLIIFTNDGNFAQNIIHPTKKIEKEYRVKLYSKIDTNVLNKLKSGISLEDGFAKAKEVSKINNDEILMVMEMGRKRVVRRMIKAVGNEVLELERIRIGNIKNNIKTGEYRKLTDKEIESYV